MRFNSGRFYVLAVPVLGFFLLILLSAARPAAAEFPRSVAIAPFASLTKEDIQQTVSVLPRLLSSRLMAIAGADVTLLPPEEKPPVDQARAAGAALLIQGSVSKLGKGYSVDAVAVDVATGKVAGAFFAAAATEDEIIPQLGSLAADMSEKLFGVKPPAPRGGVATARPAAPAPAAMLPAPTTGAPPQEAAPPPAPAAPKVDENWVPSSIKKIGQSDKIPDEVYGVVAGDVDAEGNGEVIAYGARMIYLYRVKGTELLPYTRIGKGLRDHILNVDAVDLDGDGRKEILVTNLVGEILESSILKRKGDVYEEVAGNIRYYLVLLQDWMGKPAVVGQQSGIDEPFGGKLFLMRWDGKTLKTGEPLSHNTNILPLSDGVLGLTSARLGSEWRLIYTDATSRLRIVDNMGKSEYKSKDNYGMGLDYFEWGPFQMLEQKRKQFVIRKPARLSSTGSGEKPVFLIPEISKGVLSITTGSYETTRLVLIQWDGGEFSEKAGTAKSAFFYSGADTVSPSGLRRGGKLVASVIEKAGGILSDKVSRLLLFQVD